MSALHVSIDVTGLVRGRGKMLAPYTTVLHLARCGLRGELFHDAGRV